MRNLGKFKTGFFRPKHPEKYKGDIRKIGFRSSWEETFCGFCDNNQNVIQWSFETIHIPYYNPIKKRQTFYIPDFYIVTRQRDGKISKEIIEIKPLKQVNKPTTVGKSHKQQLLESNTYYVNMAKWRACKIFCDKYGLKFRIITEKELYSLNGSNTNANRNNNNRKRYKPSTGRRTGPRRRNN